MSEQLSYSSKVLLEINKIQQDLRCDFFDATLEFCVRKEIEPADLVKKLDSTVRDRLKYSALAANLVQKKVGGELHQLDFN